MINLIEGVNPFAISSITRRKASRGGKHPLWYKYSRKNHLSYGVLVLFGNLVLTGITQPL